MTHTSFRHAYVAHVYVMPSYVARAYVQWAFVTCAYVVGASVIFLMSCLLMLPILMFILSTLTRPPNHDSVTHLLLSRRCTGRDIADINSCICEMVRAMHQDVRGWDVQVLEIRLAVSCICEILSMRLQRLYYGAWAHNFQFFGLFPMSPKSILYQSPKGDFS